ncbi:uncharacterized protein DSM5745_01813 [Aspergillus mulundensis]|uniref:Uncharacterized protein n=1 Tax=Aspergillus mulundensis TaxID=1810919 RepID=A0A3D8SW63_9EURO|nr:hypothetical protein DSM5745_01813 [Aspergillus mulundensis]RDW90038.1 hypothetical protein DSM5745_01813 [Aspergillus mulundensis]
MTNTPPASASSSSSSTIDVCYYFDRKELRLEFPYAEQATAYQALNHEGRILPDEPENVYLPIGSGMQYIRDSSIGLVLGFANNPDAKEWCRRSVLGHIHSSTEVHFQCLWEGNSLDEKLRISPSPESELEPDGYMSDPTEKQQAKAGGLKYAIPSSGPRRVAQSSMNADDIKELLQRNHRLHLA